MIKPKRYALTGLAIVSKITHSGTIPVLWCEKIAHYSLIYRQIMNILFTITDTMIVMFV